MLRLISIGVCSAVLGSAAMADGQLTVTGDGRIFVEPDMARISAGVREDAPTAREATDKMSAAIAQVLETLRAAGIDDRDIQTGSLRIAPRIDYGSGTDRGRVLGYTAQTDVSVRVLDLDRLGSILDAAVGSGAVRVSGLQFDVADRKPHKSAAREAAVLDAMDKAGVFAGAAGASLGNLISLVEGGARAAPMPMQLEATLARSEGIPIASGEISVSASVTMTYALE